VKNAGWLPSIAWPTIWSIPPGYEKRERQAPIEEKQWDGKDDQRNANAMRQTIKWIADAGLYSFRLKESGTCFLL